MSDSLGVHADRRLVEVLLRNLLGNAWKFTAKQPRAWIEVRKQAGDRETVFSIRDNGAGFNPQNAARLFGPFQRLHADSEFEGTGIGLAIVQRIVSRHAGRAWAHGEPGQSATFFFTLGDSRDEARA